MGNNQEIEKTKEDEYDFCQYIISKCRFKTTGAATGKVYATTKHYLDAYEKSIIDIAEERCSSDVVEYLKSVGAKHRNELEVTELCTVIGP